MKTGRVLLQVLKVGGKLREIRAGAVRLSKDTLGEDLLSMRVERKFFLGGWKLEEPLDSCVDVELSDVLPKEETVDAEDDGRLTLKRPVAMSIPKLSEKSARSALKIPRIGRKWAVYAETVTAESEAAVIPEPADIVPKAAKAPAKAGKAPEIQIEAQEPVVKSRRVLPAAVEPAETVAVPKEKIPEPEVKPSEPEVKPSEPEVKPSEPEVRRASADVKFQVVPTPRKRQPRLPQPQVESAVSPNPKPIKVIRRRAEEAPKVFETEPKSFPKAMMEGVKLLVEEEGDNPAE